ncbi:hypothetical protein [Micrococcoides hystricis]|uniref:DUF2157 domain-containing protein n=1 Tax=Micrococcoides hystricis TaxID=1572761 RepID=A0ABV6PCB4_9MICC
MDRPAHEHQLDPAQAQQLLGKADRLTTQSRSTASWPAIGLQLGLGAASSMYLISHRDGLFDLPAFILMMGWILALIFFSTIFGKTSKHGFGKRWVGFMIAWILLWSLGIFAPFPHAQLVAALAIMAISLIGAVWEARS